MIYVFAFQAMGSNFASSMHSINSLVGFGTEKCRVLPVDCLAPLASALSGG